MAFTGLDLAVQLSPDYVTQYGPHAGQVNSDLTKFIHAASDVQYKNQQINPAFNSYIQPKF